MSESLLYLGGCVSEKESFLLFMRYVVPNLHAPGDPFRGPLDSRPFTTTKRTNYEPLENSMVHTDMSLD
jgi:hypothetical protein